MTVERLKDFMIEAAGVARPVLNTVTRRLLDSGKLTRGTRGHAAHHLPAKDFANMALAMMVQGDGFDTVTTRIVERMEDVGELAFAHPISVMHGDSWDTETSLVTGNTFVGELTQLLVKTSDPEQALALDSIIRGVGLGYSGSAVKAWIEIAPNLEVVGPPISVQMAVTTKVDQGPFGSRLTVTKGEPAGLFRETSVNWDFIKRLAEFGAADNPKWEAS